VLSAVCNLLNLIIFVCLNILYVEHSIHFVRFVECYALTVQIALLLLVILHVEIVCAGNAVDLLSDYNQFIFKRGRLAFIKAVVHELRVLIGIFKLS